MDGWISFQCLRCTAMFVCVVALRCPPHARSHPSGRRALAVEGSAAPPGMLRSVPGFHFLHPGHVPVPRRHGLRLAERIALRAERRVQGAERRGRRREVCTEEREDGTLTCAFGCRSRRGFMKKTPSLFFFCPSEALTEQNKHFKTFEEQLSHSSSGGKKLI